MSIPYTDLELKTKRYTVKDAVDAAKLVLWSNYKIREIASTVTDDRNMSDRITLPELNTISEKIVRQSLS